MKIKSLTVKRKVKNKKPSTQNQKISNLYNIFKNVIYRNIKKNSFLLAVSGGSDSLCLSYFGKRYSLEFKNKVHFVIVDHKLRKNSTKEAAKVKKILKTKKIGCKIISWNGILPKSNIQKNARDIRYSLLSDYCKDNNVKYIVTGHHLDDQVENFFIRLIRGSGLTGLSSMTESSDYNDKIKIIRPLLEIEKKDLKFITLKYFKNYIKDPSNKTNKFLRVRVRKYIKSMEKEGLNTSKIIKTVNNLLSANKAINFYKNKALYKHTSFLSEEKCIINKKIFSQEANEVIFKSFSDVLSLVSGSYYPPRSKKVMSLITRVKKNLYKKSTLGGCLVEKKDEFIIISKERKNKKISLELQK